MKIVEELEGLVSNKIQVIKTIITIMKLEARLAGRSIIPLLLNLILVFIILITLWLMMMAILGYFVMLALDNVLGTLFLVLGLNFVLFIVLLKYMLYNLNNMSFEKTRNYFSRKESEMHENL